MRDRACVIARAAAFPLRVSSSNSRRSSAAKVTIYRLLIEASSWPVFAHRSAAQHALSCTPTSKCRMTGY
ncbi:MAG TPA: hypothetical protein VIU62_22910 [Chloroflexota bacterium]